MIKLIKKILNFILHLLGIENTKSNEIISTKNDISYSSKNLMTDYEYSFYKKLKPLENNYIIHPQINLASIINKSHGKYANELFRNIDFAIYDKDYKNLLLLIELNDNTHNSYKRKNRDLKVKKICNDANIKLITFYTKYSNEKDYVINRILKEIQK